MQDQTDALRAKGVECGFLGSAQTDRAVVDAAWAGDLPLVYITPELATTAVDRLRDLAERGRLGLVAVDEAHCGKNEGSERGGCDPRAFESHPTLSFPPPPFVRQFLSGATTSAATTGPWAACGPPCRRCRSSR